VDQKVLEAQQWVNQTYGGVSGYQACAEDGITGWGTMYSLVMGLQSELGISPVVASFGPGTTSRFAALGGVGEGWDGSPNIVTILQYGLFCKGYWSASIEDLEYGFFSPTTRSAVDQMRQNMGLPPNQGVVDEKIARCILNLDAYVVVSGGTDKIRSIQQWLNGRYYLRDAFSIGPCDGIYSRDVQKALMIGLQYELGLNANGNFGPGTQAGLRQHPLSIGDNGIFVDLFSAACVFNEPLIIDTGGGDWAELRAERQSTFSQSLAGYVEAFQRFSLLEPTGGADYGTWAQLLVSMGDPDRPVSGCDTRFEITEARAQWLVDHGYQIVGRYLYDPPGSSLDKEIKPGELDVIFQAGLRVFPIFQANARQLSDFTFVSGSVHAEIAHELAVAYGFARGTVIYFAVDYDATQAQIESAIIPYFQGVSWKLSSLGGRYLHGVYGSRNVCSNVTNATFARHSFVSGMSWGFSGNLGFPLPGNWAFNQIKEFSAGSGSTTFDLDRDAWRSDQDPGTGAVNVEPQPPAAIIGYVSSLYDLANEYRLQANEVTKTASHLVAEFIRHYKYGSWGFDYLIGSYDQGFVEYAESNGIGRFGTFIDPVSGFEISAEHLMATVDAHFVMPPEADPARVNGGDVGGWVGDLFTFYADWRNSEEDYASAGAFCEAKLAVPNVFSSFGFPDLIEDADGFLIASRMRAGENITDIVADHYGANLSGESRFTDFVIGRWGDFDTVKAAAHDALLVSWEPKVIVAKERLIELNGALFPEVVVDYEPGGAENIDELENGFVEALRLRMELELGVG
jgi:peptidoglycan hydrolase-like protein with peptidoglycan-binding domain